MGNSLKTLLVAIFLAATALSLPVGRASAGDSFGTFRRESDTSDTVTVNLKRWRGSVYNLLNRISEQSGLLFIYDSKIIDNEKSAKTEEGVFSLEDAVRSVTGNYRLKIKLEGGYALIYLPELSTGRSVAVRDDSTIVSVADSSLGYFTISGSLKDRITNEPIIYGTISTETNLFGTVSNLNGEFLLRLPDSLINSGIKFSHLGYQNRVIKASVLSGLSATFYLDQRIIPLQEIVIRAIDPNRIIREMISARTINYSKEPAYVTSFYREGVEYKGNIDLSEAVLKIYKTGINHSMSSEQVKLLKMRRMKGSSPKDSLVTRIKSTISASQQLDIVKNLPDFLQSDANDYYDFTHTDITVVDDRRVYVISFVQKEHITAALYKGKLYIDAANFALTEARFEVNPEYVRKTTDDIVVKRGRKIEIVPEKIEYIVSYKMSEGIYMVNHVRGDLHFRVRPNGKLFSSPLHAWFEMVSCKVERKDVAPFPKDERILPRDIFSNTKFFYDKDFWGNFNVILPEDNLKEFIGRYAF
ncbi:MAG: carboxypeptidase-like regulatory domain-containing protein [Bacteroidales bacterium]